MGNAVLQLGRNSNKGDTGHFKPKPINKAEFVEFRFQTKPKPTNKAKSISRLSLVQIIRQK